MGNCCGDQLVSSNIWVCSSAWLSKKIDYLDIFGEKWDDFLKEFGEILENKSIKNEGLDTNSDEVQSKEFVEAKSSTHFSKPQHFKNNSSSLVIDPEEKIDDGISLVEEFLKNNDNQQKNKEESMLEKLPEREREVRENPAEQNHHIRSENYLKADEDDLQSTGHIERLHTSVIEKTEVELQDGVSLVEEYFKDNSSEIIEEVSEKNRLDDTPVRFDNIEKIDQRNKADQSSDRSHSDHYFRAAYDEEKEEIEEEDSTEEENTEEVEEEKEETEPYQGGGPLPNILPGYPYKSKHVVRRPSRLHVPSNPYGFPSYPSHSNPMYNRFAKSTKQKNLFNSHIAKTKDNPKNNIQNLDHFIGHATETYDDLLDYLKEFDGLLFEEQQFVINLLKESAVSATKFNIVKDPKSSNGITRIRKTELKKFLLDPAQYDKIVSYILDILKRASEIGKSEIIVDSMMRLFKGLDRSSVENIYLSLVGTWANQKIINKLEVDSEAIKILQKAKVVTGGSKGVYKIDSSILQLKYVQDYISVLFEHHMTTNRHIIMKSKFDFIFGANHDISKKYKDDYTNNIAPTLENRLEDAEKSFNLKDPINFGLAIYALDSSSSIARNFEYEGLISGIEYKAKELGIDLTDQVKIRQVFDEVLLTKKRGSDTLIFLEIEGDTQMYRIETKSYFDAVLKSSTTSTHSRLIGTASQSGTKLDLFVKYQIDFKNIIEHINSRGMTEEEAVKRIQLLTNDIRDIGDMIPFYNKLQVDLANINRDKNSILLPFVMIRKIDSKANIYNINEIGPLEIQLISELLHNSNEEILEMIENPISIFNVFKANTIQFESLLNKIGINNIPTDDIKFIDFMRSKVGFIKQLSFSDPHMFDVNSNGRNILLEELRISSYNIPKDLTQNSINEIDSIFGKISFNDGKSYANANYIDIILNNKYQVIDDPNIPNIIPLPTGSAINLQMYVTRSQDDISVKNTIDKIESAYSHSSISPIFVEDRTIIDSKSRTSSAMNNLFNIHVARTYLGGEKGFSIPVLLSVPNKDPLRVYIFIPVQGGLDYTGNIYYRTKEDIREIFESELYGSPNGEFLIVGFNKITVRTITGRERLTDSRTLSSRTEVKNNIKMFERNTDSLFSFGKSTRGKVKQTNLNIEGTPLNQAQSLPPNHREVLRIADDLTDQGYHLFGRANAGLILESMMKTKKTITFGTYHGQIHIEHIEELIWIHVDTLKRDGISVSHIDEVDYKNLAEQLFLANRVHHARNTYKVWKRDSAGNIILDHEIRVIGMPKSIRGNSKIERLINYFAYNKGRNAPINSRLGDKFVDSAINNPVYRLLEKAMGIDLGIRPADRFSILFEGMVISYIEFASVKNDGVNPRQISDTIKYAHNYWSDIFDINIPGSIRLNLEKYTEILDYINYLSVIHLLSKIDSSAFLPESVRRDLSLISSSYPMYKTLTSKILEKYLLFD